jgi:hypothetical protein
MNREIWGLQCLPSSGAHIFSAVGSTRSLSAPNGSACHLHSPLSHNHIMHADSGWLHVAACQFQTPLKFCLARSLECLQRKSNCRRKAMAQRREHITGYDEVLGSNPNGTCSANILCAKLNESRDLGVAMFTLFWCTHFQRGRQHSITECPQWECKSPSFTTLTHSHHAC